MAQRSNVFTRMGRPPTPKVSRGKHPSTGEPVSAGPTEGFDGRIPGAAFRRGGSTNGFQKMPKHHPHPGFYGKEKGK